MSQVACGWYYESYIVDDLYTDNFNDYLTAYGKYFTEDIWKQYYSLEFLLQPSTARFWRPPNLRHLPFSDDPVGTCRKKPAAHATKLPRWADTVNGTYHRQTALSKERITEIAIETLRSSISRLREQHPEVPPYSETQARFWLDYVRKEMGYAGGPSYFGIYMAQGGYDVWDWQRHYTPERWHAVSDVALPPDLDDKTGRSEVGWCGWPDGGAGSVAAMFGWLPELGSEEEVDFMAAVAAEETKGCSMDKLDYALRSHMLLGLLRAVFEQEPARSEQIDKVKRGAIEKGRLEEDNADEWLRNALAVMEPYALANDVFPTAEHERTALLLKVLAENGQLFARGGWKFSARGPARGFKFDLSVALEKRRKT